jgi:hypothetical protein
LKFKPDAADQEPGACLTLARNQWKRPGSCMAHAC